MGRRLWVALRKESVDRNHSHAGELFDLLKSLSARRAWIEIENTPRALCIVGSLSARRAWIEINVGFPIAAFLLVALRKESVDRNACVSAR